MPVRVKIHMGHPRGHDPGHSWQHALRGNGVKPTIFPHVKHHGLSRVIRARPIPSAAGAARIRGGIVRLRLLASALWTYIDARCRARKRRPLHGGPRPLKEDAKRMAKGKKKQMDKKKKGKKKGMAY